MKKQVLVMAAGLVILTLLSCGKTKNLEDNQANATDDPAKINGEDQRSPNDDTDRFVDIDSAEGFNEKPGIDKDETDLKRSGYPDGDEMENLTGEYEYLSDDGNGRLMIEKTSDEYDISDYVSESSYRFLASASNIETIENNRIYIKYPEQVFSDDTVIFGYYILEYDTDKINVYYGKTAFEEAEFLYTAKKKEDSH